VAINGFGNLLVSDDGFPSFRVQEIAAQMFSPCPQLNASDRSFWVSAVAASEHNRKVHHARSSRSC
jgi:hypothetical protein